MNIRELMELAEKIARELTQAGVDDNFIKSMLAYLKNNDWEKLSILLRRMPDSGFARRSRRTKGEFEQASNILLKGNGIERYDLESRKSLIAWVCRLMKYVELLSKVGRGR